MKLYAGINGDQSGGSAAYSWTVPFGSSQNQQGVNYGIYTLVVTTVNNVEHSYALNGGATAWPLTVLNNP